VKTATIGDAFALPTFDADARPKSDAPIHEQETADAQEEGADDD
jgi:hypothetical protein